MSMSIFNPMGLVWILLFLGIIFLILTSIIKYSVDRSNLSKELRKEISDIKLEIRQVRELLEKRK